MRNWKKTAAALGVAMVMMVPGAIYGTDVEPINVVEAYGRIDCFDWDWLIDQFKEYIQVGDDTVVDAPEASIAREMLDLVNEERRAVGLSELKLSGELSNVAELKAKDMRDQGYFSHTSPTYGSPFEMMETFGIHYKTAGENIAKGQRSVEQVMKEWMNSSGHRANVLNERYTHLGVGYVTDGAGNGYWVQMFIGV